MERAAFWTTAFKVSLRSLELNGAGMTSELAARRPAEGVASAGWILGHLVEYRRRVLRLAGAEVPEDAAWTAQFARGTSGEAARTWDELMAAFRAVDAQTAAALAALPDWEKPTPNPAIGRDQTLEQVIAFLYMHECYHLGQIGLIRRLLGLPGAI